jgi:hypothetical protein
MVTWRGVDVKNGKDAVGARLNLAGRNPRRAWRIDER